MRSEHPHVNLHIAYAIVLALSSQRFYRLLSDTSISGASMSVHPPGERLTMHPMSQR